MVKMDFYDVISSRRTIRNLKNGPVKKSVLERIIGAGINAPTNNHLREWEFLVLQSEQEKENALQFAKEYTLNRVWGKISGRTEKRKEMYSYAMPR